MALQTYPRAKPGAAPVNPRQYGAPTMIVVMKRSATEQDIQSMIEHVEALKMKPVVLRGTERTVIAAIGEERVAGIGSLESGPGVDEVLPILAPYKLASRELQPEPT